MDSEDYTEVLSLRTQNRHLKETVRALREKLEEMQREQSRRIQEGLAASQEEISQLKGTVVALREEMEKRLAQYEKDRQAAELAHGQRVRQLKETILALRDLLEKGREKT